MVGCGCFSGFPSPEGLSPLQERAFRLAMGGLACNIRSVSAGIFREKRLCLMAGLDYDTPWTRDASFNVYFALAALDAGTAENTLFSVLEEKDGKTLIGGQYWDRAVWALGAYRLWQVTKSRALAERAYTAIRDTVLICEKEEQDETDGLFFGAAVYGDGVSAYPEKYRNPDLDSGIARWPRKNPGRRRMTGGGLPMKALSTNCMYTEVYRILSKFAASLGKTEEAEEYRIKHGAMKRRVDRAFWNEKNRNYDYLLGESEAQEGLGLAFALLFDIAPGDRAEMVMNNTFAAPAGLPCVWPSFEPYRGMGGYGRHSGTVWPHVQGFWALACLHRGRRDLFETEARKMAENAVNSGQFAEIYHPETGKVYGGIQDAGGKYDEWKSCSCQAWSAAAYLSLVLYGICGLREDESVPARGSLRVRGADHII